MRTRWTLSTLLVPDDGLGRRRQRRSRPAEERHHDEDAKVVLTLRGRAAIRALKPALRIPMRRREWSSSGGNSSPCRRGLDPCFEPLEDAAGHRFDCCQLPERCLPEWLGPEIFQPGLGPVVDPRECGGAPTFSERTGQILRRLAVSWRLERRRRVARAHQPRTPTSASCGKCSQPALLRAGVAERLMAVVCAFRAASRCSPAALSRPSPRRR